MRSRNDDSMCPQSHDAVRDLCNVTINRRASGESETDKCDAVFPFRHASLDDSLD
jgi:hypothetical protein